MEARSHSSNYRPDIDGLRAIAVLAVLFFHADHRPQIFGFAGISTLVFLIAGLLVAKLQGLPGRLPAEALRYDETSQEVPFRKQLGLKEVMNGEFLELGSGETNKLVEPVW